MPLSDRDYMREEHPPACTCVACEKRRADRYRSGRVPAWKRLLRRLLPWLR